MKIKKKNININVILASRPKMVSDVLKNMIEQQPDMEVIGQVLDPIELIVAAKLMPADVVIITPLKMDGEPRICNQLLKEHPLLKIIILSADSRAAFLFQSGTPKTRIDDPSEQSILNTIRHSMQ